MQGRIIYNKEHSGIELYFERKPDDAVFNALKEAGFRFHRQKRCLFAKRTPERERLALQYADTATGIEEPPRRDGALEAAWTPGYDHVDGLPIYPDSSKIEIDTTGGYFADIDACIAVKFNITITDLQYALTPGQQCTQIAISSDDHGSARPAAHGLNTFRELYDKYYTRREAPGDGFTVYERHKESMRTFTPFKRISPIKMPKKWTVPHIWKGILSGQIYYGVVDGRYSDDYAFDSGMNFFQGRGKHLPSFAKELIESPSGWHTYTDSTDGNTAVLSVNCHTFDANTVYFDESCDWPEAQRRREAMTAEVARHNYDLEKQILTIDPANVAPAALYDISYLEMDGNTNRYSVKTAIVTGREIADEGYCPMPIIAMAPHNVEKPAFYVISDFHRRPAYDDDPRLIDMGNWQTIVSGMALAELAAEGWRFAVIYRAGDGSFNTYRDDLNAHISGERVWMFGTGTDYRQSLNRLNAEYARATKVETQAV